MKELEFKNLIDSNTGETVKIEVDDDFDTAPMEEWGRRGRESGERMRTAFGKSSDE